MLLTFQGPTALRFIVKVIFLTFTLTLSILVKKLPDTNKHVIGPHVNKYVQVILVKFQFTLFPI